MKYILIVISLLISGCSMIDALDAVNPLKEDKGISATVQVGKENNSDTSKQLLKSNINTQEETSYVADSIGKVDNSTNIPWWSALLLLFVKPLVVLKESIELFRRKEG